MLARTLLDEHYRDLRSLTLAIADALGAQAAALQCACVQVDEANIPGNPADGPLAAEAINRVLANVLVEKAVHFCFGNYGGQTIQQGTWAALITFLNSLKVDHVVLELAHRPPSDLEALRELDSRIGVGLGVIDIKINQIETAEDVARSIERADRILGPGRIRYVHPDCGFWMLKRSIVDRKIAALVKGRDLYLGSR
jgi:5-methyltetrahydropteroyltriglutamate--homocysteine methyltransferase